MHCRRRKPNAKTKLLDWLRPLGCKDIPTHYDKPSGLLKLNCVC